MTQVNEYRQKSRTSWRGYNAACGSVYHHRTLSFIHRYESVDSYRGKPVYLDIGNKRRKRFNSFERYKRFWCPMTEEYLCRPSGNIWFEDFTPILTMQYCVDPEGGLAKGWYSGTLPPIDITQMKEIGEDFRDFVVRDLFVKANSPRFDTAVFLAELDETLVDVHKLLLGSVKALVKADHAWKVAKHLVLNPEELWLWWRYMLMPTLMDAEDLLKAIKPQDKIDRVQDGDRPEPYRINGSIISHNWNGEDIEIPWDTEVSIGLGGAIDIYSRCDPSPWGTSAFDIVRGTWERIPFSFVADWFVNLGDYLASIRNAEVSYAQSYATYAIECKHEFPLGDMQQSGVTPYCYSFVQRRIVDLEPPTLPLVDKRWRSIYRTVDLISLTASIIKSILGKRR